MFHAKVFRWVLLISLFHNGKTQSTDDESISQGYDCSHIWTRNNTFTSGIYMIKPLGSSRSFQVFCEMDDDGGWTLIQKHNGQDGLSFDRTWNEYKLGFGNITSEHWLGLDNINALTDHIYRIPELRISLGDFDGAEAVAHYSSFRVDHETNFYQLSLGNYFGNAGDAFRGRDSDTNEDGSFFSTKDKDNDNCSPCRMGDIIYYSCSEDEFSAGWWFNRCGIANLNGQWHPQGANMWWASSISWETWRSIQSLKFSKMYLRHH
ncbi:angiopoietin-related protein 5-like [Ascaphus truei]|uniref:angiopoietin-related protein 5-like n=1 Tax=Ascaphus truei TaxID=8439 RepID=UPI003F5AA591